MGSWNLFKKILAKKSEQAKIDERHASMTRIDKDLPLGIRFNGFVEIPKIDFIMGESDGLKMKHPGDMCNVLSYGKFNIASSTVHRFYLNGANNTVFTLQVVTDNRKNIEECKLFMPHDEVYPDDWDFWLNDQSGYVGYSAFQLQGNQNLDVDALKKQADKLVAQIEALQEANQMDAAKKKQLEYDEIQKSLATASVDYCRVWEDQGKQVEVPDNPGFTRIPPVEFTETLYLDEYGESWESVSYRSMLYGRAVNENVDEFVLLSVVEDKDGASVQIMIGIQLNPLSLKII